MLALTEKNPGHVLVETRLGSVQSNKFRSAVVSICHICVTSCQLLLPTPPTTAESGMSSRGRFVAEPFVFPPVGHAADSATQRKVQKFASLQNIILKIFKANRIKS